MRLIVQALDGGGLAVFNPFEGARLAKRVRLADGRDLLTPQPQPVDRFLRGWPVEGAVVDWAETENEFLGRLAAHMATKGGGAVRIVDEVALPADRSFRDAWTLVGGSVTHDMAKAREIRRAQLRAERAPLLKALDVDFMRAIEEGDGGRQAQIAARKQALRDVTGDPAIEAAQTPEELKAALPAVLRA